MPRRSVPLLRRLSEPQFHSAAVHAEHQSVPWPFSLPVPLKNIAGRRNHKARPVLRHSDMPNSLQMCRKPIISTWGLALRAAHLPARFSAAAALLRTFAHDLATNQLHLSQLRCDLLALPHFRLRRFAPAPLFGDQTVGDVILVDVADVRDCFASDPLRGDAFDVVEPEIGIETSLLLSRRSCRTRPGPAL